MKLVCLYSSGTRNPRQPNSSPNANNPGIRSPTVPLALIIHGTSGWLVSMDGLGCGVALAG